MDELLSVFPGSFRESWKKILAQVHGLEEIRMRVDQPVQLLCRGRECWVTESFKVVFDQPEQEKSYLIHGQELQSILEHLCHYSLYAFEEELRQGFVTIPGGHRVGMAGQVVLTEQGRVKGFRYIRYINIRLAREHRDCARKLLSYIYEKGELCNLLLVSPPGAGKTTMLRDLVRLISDGNEYGKGKKVAVVDERSELAGCYQGIPQKDVGCRTDVLDGCPKAEGMMMLIRSMSPQVLAVDEIGTETDAAALHVAFATGCHVISTIHGNCLEDLQRKTFLRQILQERWFRRYIFLEKKEGNFQVRELLDLNFRNLWDSQMDFR